MPVADNGLVRPLIGFSLDFAATVALNSLDKTVSDTHDNTRVICCAVIVRVLKEDLVTDFGGLIEPSSRLIILHREAAACAVLARLALKIFGFVLASAKFEKAPVNKLVAPVKALLVTVVVPRFVQVS